MANLKVHHGNILDTQDVIIFHSCNAYGVMGAGVAKVLADLYPSVAKLFYEHAQKYGLVMGENYNYQVSKDRIIVNCVTQQFTGTQKRQVDYPSLEKSIKKTVELATALGYKSVTCPLISCGLAGGNPNVILPMLMRAAEESGVTINMYIYEKSIYDDIMSKPYYV